MRRASSSAAEAPSEPLRAVRRPSREGRRSRELDGSTISRTPTSPLALATPPPVAVGDEAAGGGSGGGGELGGPMDGLMQAMLLPLRPAPPTAGPMEAGRRREFSVSAHAPFGAAGGGASIDVSRRASIDVSRPASLDSVGSMPMADEPACGSESARASVNGAAAAPSRACRSVLDESLIQDHF